MTRAYSPRGASTRMKLVGYPIEIGNSSVTIFDKRRPAVKLATVPSLRAARLFLRGYRRTPSNVEATARPRQEIAAASTKQGA